MSRGWRTILWAVLLAALVVVANEPLVGAGASGDDFHVLADASHLAWGSGRHANVFFKALGTDARPLAALSLAASSSFWTEGGRWTAHGLLALRLENLVLLVAGATCLGLFARRLLLPWAGEEQARAAGDATLMLLVLHPLSVPVVASAGARGELFGGLLAALTAYCFLRGRQEQRYGWVFGAAALTFACALASEFAWLLPPWLAVAEYLSARRYRPSHVRLRTAATTLAAFGGGVVLEALVRVAVGVSWRPVGIERALASLETLDGAWSGLVGFFVKLGLLIVPVNPAGVGMGGFFLAGAFLLFVLGPALRAARSAPRFWTGVLGAWIVLMVVAILFRADRHVEPTDLSEAAELFPAVAVMALGLAVASTARTGKRRMLYPVLASLGLCALARIEAAGARDASRAAAELQARLLAARDACSPGESGAGTLERYLVLDPPGLVAGHAAVGEELEWLLHRYHVEGAGAGEVWARGASPAALLAYAREPELDELRRAAVLVVLAPEAGPLAEALPPWTALGPPVPAGADLFWREDGRSPALALDAPNVRSLRARPRPGAPTTAVPRMGWRSEKVQEGALEGRWLVGEEGPQALFDLSGSLRWVLSGELRRVWLQGGLATLVDAQLSARGRTLPGVDRPALRGDDWVFAPELHDLARPLSGEVELALCLLDLDRLRYVELPVDELPGDEWRVRGAEPLAARWAEEGSRVAWSLERRVDGVCVARTRGR